MANDEAPLDILVVAPHPDDAELGMGGAILQFKAEGYRVGVLDLTNGEPTPLRHSRNSGPGNGRRHENPGTRLARQPGPAESQPRSHARRPAASWPAMFRQLRPRLLFAPYWVDAHPDHVAATELIEAARFWSKLTKTDLPGEPHYPERILYYYCVHLRLVQQPAFVLDISRTWAEKLAAIECYRSQFIAGRPTSRRRSWTGCAIRRPSGAGRSARPTASRLPAASRWGWPACAIWSDGLPGDPAMASLAAFQRASARLSTAREFRRRSSSTQRSLRTSAHRMLLSPHRLHGSEANRAELRCGSTGKSISRSATNLLRRAVGSASRAALAADSLAERQTRVV